VALKVIRPGYVPKDFFKRFELETQILGRLQHRGIAQIFEAGTAPTKQGHLPFFGEEHPHALIAINNVGYLLQVQGKLEQAEPYYREALERRRRVLGN
jgi:serine/threonine protein kinase